MLDRTWKRVGHEREREVGDGRRGIRGEMGKPIRITCGRDSYYRNESNYSNHAIFQTPRKND